MTYEAVVLAAGRSSRAGGFKPAMDCGGLPLVVRVVRAFEGLCERVWVVTGYRGDEVATLVSEESGVTVVHNQDWGLGMFSSVRAGVSKVTADRFFVTPGDLPLVSSSLVLALAAVADSVVVPVWSGKSGHPVLLDRTWVNFILNADPASTLRSVLTGAARSEVFTNDDSVLRDIDTCEDYQELVGRWRTV